MRRRPFRRCTTALAVATLATTACALDEAALARPGDGPIAAEQGDLRVLGYQVDPATDRWVDVLEPDPSVVTETETFRETDAALLAEGDEPGDRRRLFDAVGEGRTLLVELNCADDVCAPEAPRGDVEIHVWEFVVDGASAVTDDTGLARPGASVEVRVGEFVVIAGDRNAEFEQVPGPDDEIVVSPVARHEPAGDDGLHVDVFVAVDEGRSRLHDVANDRFYDIEVTSAG